MPKLMAMIDKFAGDDPNSFPKQREVIRKVINDPTDNWYKYIMNVVKNVDNDVLKTVFTNFIVNANLIGWPSARRRCRQEVQLQCALGHSAGSHLCLQPALHRLLGRGIRQQAEPDL